MTSERTQRRDRQRTADQRDALECARKLFEVVEHHPRFKEPIGRAISYVRLQLRPDAAKRTIVIKCLRAGGLLSLTEIMDDTSLDRGSAMLALEQLMPIKVEALQRHSNQSGSRLTPTNVASLSELLLRNGTLNKPTYFRLRLHTSGHASTASAAEED